MKIKCTCGELIRDQTDYLKHKAHLIPDIHWFDFWNAIDAAIEKSGTSKKDKEEACMQLRKQNMFRRLWECTNCGKLYIDNANYNLVSYSSDSNKYNGVLDQKE
ncbi:hypothetical protein [Maribacter sp.]|uniref:hypothetical protein n=1 Tax=Maribacter sp. TaxID=1897614 RepID=UPI0025BBB596|nr:hypothetical protein [Maribacter sp.]